MNNVEGAPECTEQTVPDEAAAVILELTQEVQEKVDDELPISCVISQII